jgi:hypothetical protein
VPRSLVCSCPNMSLASEGPYLARSADPGVRTIHLRTWCKTSRLVRCSLSSSPIVVLPSPPPANAHESVAWCFTGGLRSFFAPIVHESLLRHGIYGLGGRPRVFFSASLVDDAKAGRASISVGGGSRTDAAARASSCSTLHANLSAFLAVHDEWAAITAFVSESSSARPPAATAARASIGACALPRDVVDAFDRPHYIAQIARWQEVYLAVQRDEVARGVRFGYVARLRFDVTLGAPLPHTILRPDLATMVWPVGGQLFSRLLPLPDHFWLVPRPYAHAAFGILSRFQQCGHRAAATTTADGRTHDRSHHTVSSSTSSHRGNATFDKDATIRACEVTGLCADQPGLPEQLCCGGGPTGLLVRALLREQMRTQAAATTTTATITSRTVGHRRGGGGGGDSATPFKAIPIEHPIMLVGDDSLARLKCAGRAGIGWTDPNGNKLFGEVASSQLGYFARAQDCVALTSACSAASPHKLEGGPRR